MRIEKLISLALAATLLAAPATAQLGSVRPIVTGTPRLLDPATRARIIQQQLNLPADPVLSETATLSPTQLNGGGARLDLWQVDLPSEGGAYLHGLSGSGVNLHWQANGKPIAVDCLLAGDKPDGGGVTFAILWNTDQKIGKLDRMSDHVVLAVPPSPAGQPVEVRLKLNKDAPRVRFEWCKLVTIG